MSKLEEWDDRMGMLVKEDRLRGGKGTVFVLRQSFKWGRDSRRGRGRYTCAVFTCFWVSEAVTDAKVGTYTTPTYRQRKEVNARNVPKFPCGFYR